MSLKVYSVILFVLCAKSLQVSSFWTPPPTEPTTLSDSAANNCEETDPTTTESTTTNSTATDSTTTDSTTTDSSETDAPECKSAETDSTESDTTTTDSTTTDSTTTDSTTTDSTTTDSTTADSTTTDSTTSDSTTTDSTTTDSSATDGPECESAETDSTGSDATTTDSTTTDSSATEPPACESTETESTESDTTTTESTSTDSSATEPPACESTETESTETDTTTTDSSATDSTTTDSSATDSTTTDSAVTEREAEEEQCPNGLLLIGEDELNILVISNVEVRADVFLDLNNNLIALGNGTSPSGVVIDIVTRKGVYLNSNDPEPKEIPIREYVSSLKGGLKPFLSQKNAIHFEVGNAPPLVLESVNLILEKLIIGISGELQSNPKEGLQLFVAVASEILKIKQTVLKGSVQVLGIQGACVHADLAGLYNAIKGLALIFGRIPGGIPAILQAGGEINYPKIANGKNGLEALAELIRGIGKDKDIAEILGEILNEPETLLKVVSLLSGSINDGLAGVLKVAAAAAEYANKEKSLEYFINVILQFLAANSKSDVDPEEVSNQRKQSRDLLLEAIKEVKLSDSLSGAVEVLKSFEEGNMEINKVKISSILSILISAINKPNELQAVVKVLLELRDVIEIEESLVKLLIVLMLDVDSPLGIELLKEIGIPVDINIEHVSGSILEHILKSVSDLVSRISHNLYEALCSVPALDKIVNAVNSAVSGCGLDKDLKNIISANQAAEILIKAVLQVIGQLELEVPEDTCAKVGETAETCSQIDFYLSIEVNVTLTAESGHF